LFSVDKLIILISLKHDLEREFIMQGFLTKSSGPACADAVALAPRADAGAAAAVAASLTSWPHRQTPEILKWKTS
jgi:hypothetical protein